MSNIVNTFQVRIKTPDLVENFKKNFWYTYMISGENSDFFFWSETYYYTYIIPCFFADVCWMILRLICHKKSERKINKNKIRWRIHQSFNNYFISILGSNLKVNKKRKYFCASWHSPSNMKILWCPTTSYIISSLELHFFLTVQLNCN